MKCVGSGPRVHGESGFRQTWAWGSADPITIPFACRQLLCFSVAFAPHNGKTMSDPRPLCAPITEVQFEGEKKISIISRSANNSVVARRWLWAGHLRQQAVCTYWIKPAWVTATTAWTLTGRQQFPRDELGNCSREVRRCQERNNWWIFQSA